MGIQRHVAERDVLHAAADFHSDPYAIFFSGKAGEIGVTDSDILHARGKTVDIISIDEVSSVQYTEPKMPKTYLYTGLAALTFAFFGDGVAPGLAAFSWLLGPVLLLTGYWYRTSTLTIYTPTRDYELQSRDSSLGDVVEAYQQRRQAHRD